MKNLFALAGVIAIIFWLYSLAPTFVGWSLTLIGIYLAGLIVVGMFQGLRNAIKIVNEVKNESK